MHATTIQYQSITRSKSQVRKASKSGRQGNLINLTIIIIDGNKRVTMRRAPLRVIRVAVEACKQCQEERPVKDDEPGERHVIITINKEQLKSVHGENDKLNHLQPSQVLFPPEKPPHRRPERSQQVIRVHDRVNERVEQGEQ